MIEHDLLSKVNVGGIQISGTHSCVPFEGILVLSALKIVCSLELTGPRESEDTTCCYNEALRVG